MTDLVNVTLKRSEWLIIQELLSETMGQMYVYNDAPWFDYGDYDKLYMISMEIAKQLTSHLNDYKL